MEKMKWRKDKKQVQILDKIKSAVYSKNTPIPGGGGETWNNNLM
jgi:hypothetical protein